MIRILVPIDTSPVSTVVAETAARLTAGRDAHITLLNVAPREPDVLGKQLRRKVVEEPVPNDVRERYDELQRIAGQLRDNGISCDTRMVRGLPVPTILDEVKRLEADAIVMGSHGRGLLYRRMMGSVSEGILRAGPCPLLIIPIRRDEDAT